MHPTLTRLAGARGIVTIAALASLTMATACLSSDKLTGTSNGGQFTASVSGDLTGGLAGNAEVVQIAPAGSTTPNAVALGLIDQSGTIMAFQWAGRTSVTAGTYNIGTDSTTTTGMALVFASGARYVGGDGTIVIATATTSSVTGSFNLHAFNADSSQHLTITGNFTAPVLGAGAAP